MDFSYKKQYAYAYRVYNSFVSNELNKKQSCRVAMFRVKGTKQEAIMQFRVKGTNISPSVSYGL
jgi:hypothetical protein